MFKKIITATALAATLAIGTAAAEPFTGFYVGGEISYDNGPISFDQLGYGAIAGYNTRLTDRFYIGVEGEISGSTSSFVDVTFGGHGTAGFLLTERASVFARAGYREFDFDFGLSGGDFTLGVGSQIFLTDSIAIRGIVDTTGFDIGGVRGAIIWEF